MRHPAADMAIACRSCIMCCHRDLQIRPALAQVPVSNALHAMEKRLYCCLLGKGVQEVKDKATAMFSSFHLLNPTAMLQPAAPAGCSKAVQATDCTPACHHGSADCAAIHGPQRGHPGEHC